MPFAFAGLWGPDAFTDSYGNVLAGATLTVYNVNTLVAATLYTDQSKGTVGVNPVSPDVYGNFSFWANPGQYDLAVNYQGQVVQSLKGMIVFTNPQETSGVAVPDGSITGGPAAIGVKLAQTTITHDNVALANRDGIAATPSMRTLGTGAAQAMAGNDSRVVAAAALVPGALTGAVAATRYVGGTASGAPITGTFAVGDFIIDQTGVIWICTTAGTPGTWKTISAGAIENVNVVAASGAAYTIPDVTTATIDDIKLTANCTFTFPTAGVGKNFTLVIRQDATGNRTAVFPGTVQWFGGTVPVLQTAANAWDMISFICTDGTNWLAAPVEFFPGGDTSWTAAVFTNGWVWFGAPTDQAKFRKLGNGLVVMTGAVKTGTAQTSVFTLPVGYRPAGKRIFVSITGAGAFGELDVFADGTVVPQQAGNAFQSLDCAFYAEQ